MQRWPLLPRCRILVLRLSWAPLVSMLCQCVAVVSSVSSIDFSFCNSARPLTARVMAGTTTGGSIAPSASSNIGVALLTPLAPPRVQTVPRSVCLATPCFYLPAPMALCTATLVVLCAFPHALLHMLLHVLVPLFHHG